MKLRHIINTVCLALLVMPIIADAQIYKWKDKNGVTRYSDTPPIGVKANPIGKEGTAKPITPPKANSAKDKETTSTTREVMPKSKSEKGDIVDPPMDPKLKADRERARKAEMEKKKKENEAEKAKVKAENCKAAKANYRTLAQGGRVYETNEKGERIYMGDAELKANKARAQANVNKYCK